MAKMTQKKKSWTYCIACLQLLIKATNLSQANDEFPKMLGKHKVFNSHFVPNTQQHLQNV